MGGARTLEVGEVARPEGGWLFQVPLHARGEEQGGWPWRPAGFERKGRECLILVRLVDHPGKFRDIHRCTSRRGGDASRPSPIWAALGGVVEAGLARSQVAERAKRFSGGRRGRFGLKQLFYRAQGVLDLLGTVWTGLRPRTRCQGITKGEYLRDYDKRDRSRQEGCLPLTFPPGSSMELSSI